ncbi:hypothetical protein OOZ51_14430 [Arthrobacter sp. MI7-26]|uniref:hypothetical protein n=1 Tax=Arthrobacter sp. MI7-26 TaxID=2993653 RepID=UPI00224952E0|nr:hypothetical protein [Arthrobacter sp. MI7-26]MCX2749002.1 hypothetical protein [Arthrobacter sp. MI7-26]
MNTPFFLRRRLSSRPRPDGTNLTRQGLSGADLTDPTFVASRISHPDTLTPSPYSSTAPLPNTDEKRAGFENELIRILVEAHKRGTLDEDSYDFADGIVSSWLGSWLQQLQAENDGRRQAAAGLIATHLDYQTQLMMRLEQTERELGQLVALNSDHVAKLQGEFYPDPSVPDEEKTVPIGKSAPRPVPIQLSGLGLKEQDAGPASPTAGETDRGQI